MDKISIFSKQDLLYVGTDLCCMSSGVSGVFRTLTTLCSLLSENDSILVFLFETSISAQVSRVRLVFVSGSGAVGCGARVAFQLHPPFQRWRHDRCEQATRARQAGRHLLLVHGEGAAAAGCVHLGEWPFTNWNFLQIFQSMVKIYCVVVGYSGPDPAAVGGWQDSNDEHSSCSRSRHSTHIPQTNRCTWESSV